MGFLKRPGPGFFCNAVWFTLRNLMTWKWMNWWKCRKVEGPGVNLWSVALIVWLEAKFITSEVQWSMEQDSQTVYTRKPEKQNIETFQSSI